MDRFTVEETNLICIYNTGTREGLLDELSEMQTHLEQDDTELIELIHPVFGKLNTMKDNEFEDIIVELVVDFD